jgi:signal transduction histidine kinase
MEDDDHRAWLYLPCGLVRIDRAELDGWVENPARFVKTTVFDESDGVRTHAFPSHPDGVTKSADGRIWFVAFDGVSFIDPHRLAFNKVPPPVHIEGIVGDGKRYNVIPGLRLPPGVRNLAIDFVALSLVVPEKNRYRFRLDGWDPGWTDAVNELRVEYTNLPPRKYRFRVIASNNNGLWNETGDALEFSIAPAYYQTTWFAAACVAAVLAMLWLLYQLRLRRITREFTAQLDGRVEERLRVSRELHDTLLQTFQAALIQMQAAYMMFWREPERAIKILEKAMTTSEDAIKEGRDAIQNIRSSTVEKNDIARALRIAGDQMAAQGSATFEVRVQGSSRDVHPILRDEVYRIALEGMRNAFQHAQANAIQAEIVYGDSLKVRISDDGKGIDPATVNQRRAGHYGLAGMRERAESIGGNLEVSSAPGVGTEIQLSIPGGIAFGGSGAGSLFRRLRRKRKKEAAAQR